MEVIRAPSKDLFKLFTLSISRFIYITFFADIGFALGSTFLNNRAKLYLLDCSVCTVFFTVGFVEPSNGFFLKSALRSLFGIEYLVFTYLV